MKNAYNNLNTQQPIHLNIPEYNLQVEVHPIHGFPSVMVKLDRDIDEMNEFGVSLMGDVVPEINEITHIYNKVKSHMKRLHIQRSEENRLKENHLREIMQDPLKELARTAKFH